MKNIKPIFRKYYQAPWRTQNQRIGLFLLSIVIAAMVAGIYLNITARAALAGREVQMLEAKMTDNQRLNADLETQLATATSSEIMQERAKQMGFQSIRPEDVTYISVPGYIPKPPLDMSSKKSEPSTPIILPAYTQSLFDWLSEQISASLPITGIQP